MNIIQLSNLKPSADRAARFQGSDHNAATSFFVVVSPPGRGVNKHRHPYEETLIVLEGEVETTIGQEMQSLNKGTAVVIPPQTWHEFVNRSTQPLLMVTIHASPDIIQENWEKPTI